MKSYLQLSLFCGRVGSLDIGTHGLHVTLFGAGAHLHRNCREAGEPFAWCERTGTGLLFRLGGITGAANGRH
jgi:hypothetical protein